MQTLYPLGIRSPKEESALFREGPVEDGRMGQIADGVFFGTKATLAIVILLAIVNMSILFGICAAASGRGYAHG